METFNHNSQINKDYFVSSGIRSIANHIRLQELIELKSGWPGIICSPFNHGVVIYFMLGKVDEVENPIVDAVKCEDVFFVHVFNKGLYLSLNATNRPLVSIISRIVNTLSNYCHRRNIQLPLVNTWEKSKSLYLLQIGDRIIDSCEIGGTAYVQMKKDNTNLLNETVDS